MIQDTIRHWITILFPLKCSRPTELKIAPLPTACVRSTLVSEKRSNIYLIGPMGSGKTTLGQRIAGLLGMDFHDSDRELEKQTGASVNLIFDVEGETGFRERETRVLDRLTAMENVLLATGGGAITIAENREMLSRTGLVVYLQTSVSQQLSRLRRDRSRPLLHSGNREQKLKALATVRNPLYLQIADVVFPSLNRGPAIAARMLADTIISHQAQANATGTDSEHDDK